MVFGTNYLITHYRGPNMKSHFVIISVALTFTLPTALFAQDDKNSTLSNLANKFARAKKTYSAMKRLQRMQVRKAGDSDRTHGYFRTAGREPGYRKAIDKLIAQNVKDAIKKYSIKSQFYGVGKKAVKQSATNMLNSLKNKAKSTARTALAKTKHTASGFAKRTANQGKSMAQSAWSRIRTKMPKRPGSISVKKPKVKPRKGPK